MVDPFQKTPNLKEEFKPGNKLRVVDHQVYSKYDPSSHNHGSVENGCISNISFLSFFRVTFHFHDYGRKCVFQPLHMRERERTQKTHLQFKTSSDLHLTKKKELHPFFQVPHVKLRGSLPGVNNRDSQKKKTEPQNGEDSDFNDASKRHVPRFSVHNHQGSPLVA